MEQSGVMHPSIANMTLGVPKHVVAVILTGGGPNALSIRPTDFFTYFDKRFYIQYPLIILDEKFFKTNN